MYDPLNYYEETQQGQMKEEEIKVSIEIEGCLLIIALTNAVPDPRAVMVETLYTIITEVAVRGTRRTKQQACPAKT